MATYFTDELVFDLPDGFADESLTMLSSPNAAQPLSITVAREPAARPLGEHVAAQLTTIQKLAPQTKLLGARDRDIGNLPGRELKLATTAGKQPLYVRQSYVDYYGTFLSFSVSAPRSHQAACDATAERLLSGVQFRRR